MTKRSRRVLQHSRRFSGYFVSQMSDVERTLCSRQPFHAQVKGLSGSRYSIARVTPSRSAWRGYVHYSRPRRLDCPFAAFCCDCHDSSLFRNLPGHANPSSNADACRPRPSLGARRHELRLHSRHVIRRSTQGVDALSFCNSSHASCPAGSHYYCIISRAGHRHSSSVAR